MKSHPKIIKQTIHGNMKFNEGELIIWGMPCQIFAVNTLVLQQKLMEYKLGKDAWNILYQIGKLQAKKGGEIMYKKWGYPRNKKNADIGNQQGELVGMGRQQYLKFDPENKHFIVKVINNSFAKQHLKLYGKHNEPVDHFMRGLVTGANVAASETDLVGIETQCVAMGKPYCIIEVKEKEKWDLSDENVKAQFPDQIIDEKILEEKESLLALLKSR